MKKEEIEEKMWELGIESYRDYSNKYLHYLLTVGLVIFSFLFGVMNIPIDILGKYLFFKILLISLFILLVVMFFYCLISMIKFDKSLAEAYENKERFLEDLAKKKK